MFWYLSADAHVFDDKYEGGDSMDESSTSRATSRDHGLDRVQAHVFTGLDLRLQSFEVANTSDKGLAMVKFSRAM